MVSSLNLAFPLSIILPDSLSLGYIGGTTYIALASLYLAPSSSETDPLTPEEKRQTVKWLMSTQTSSGGFCGRTGKVGDSCYCFWCGASLKVTYLCSVYCDTQSLTNTSW